MLQKQNSPALGDKKRKIIFLTTIWRKMSKKNIYKGKFLQIGFFSTFSYRFSFFLLFLIKFLQ